MHKRERRFLQSDVSVQSGEQPKISGYCAVFNSRSHDLGNFVEEIDPKAFDAHLASNPDIVGLFNHSNDMVLGRTTSGTMKVSVDAHGVKYEIDPPDTSYAKDLVVSMKRGDIASSSFGFFCDADSWSVDKKTGQHVRRILAARIFDASIVTNPAYADATSQVRALFPDDKGHIPEEISEKIAELRFAQSAKEDRVATRNMRSVRSVMNAVSRTAWAILPEKLEVICQFIKERSEGKISSKEEIQAAMMGFDQDDLESEPTSGVAVIPVYGTIGQKMNMMTQFSGGASCEELSKQIRTALADDSVTSIVLDIDSPGGTVTGVPELAAEILAARGVKPIVAVANGMAASAALWIGASCEKFYCMPSGEVGSIGVYCTHQDMSGALAKAGVKMTFIQAGKFKTEGNPYMAPSEEYLADAQAGVDTYYDMFLQAVADGRGVSVETVTADFGQGRMLMAKDALAVGLIDGVATLDAVVSGLLSTESAVALNVVTASDVKASMNESCSCSCEPCMNGNCEECEDEDCDWLDGDEDPCDCGFDDNYAESVEPSVKADNGTCTCHCGPCMDNDCGDCEVASCEWDIGCPACDCVDDVPDETEMVIESVAEITQAEADENERVALLVKFMSIS